MKTPLGAERTQVMLKTLLPIGLFVAYILLQFGAWDDATLCLYGDWESLRTHPWSLITYALVHYSPIHLSPILILLSVIILLTKGKVSAGMYWLIFSCGVLSGALTFVIIASLSASPTLATLSGASGGTTALMSFCIILLSRRGRRAMAIALLALIIMTDHLTFSLHNTLGFYSHLSGYTLGIIFALIIIRRSDKSRKLVDCKESVISKANSSGYNSLSEEEKNIIRNEEKHLD
ncbi:rhomboid family intramembrane serine protease [Porphyromonas cangingivalis]|uniref:Membrane associated serine protease, rhomboid family n=1 Tax=Porphyromonas cangingivalis TaxID=36874 RepID=A0A1T4LUP2_PORCN|nr:rhomboid family intramembrane serine protease [Porphyromonas cangingivalis]SJZ58346.1 Membrane associated serine protease, rhomboid family [Porphyromonas cangingivalis]VEJ01986.1 rhombosortase [Porphyromonas cangingivalis]